MIISSCRYNTRHKIVIAIFATVALLLNIPAAKVILGEPVEKEHLQCIELQKDPLCKSGASKSPYEVSMENMEVYKISDYNSCEEYYANPKMSPPYNVYLFGVCGIYWMIEAVIIAYWIIKLSIGWIAKLFRWLNRVEVEDEDQ